MEDNEHYDRYCAAAQALAVVGEKWSLLIIRDLLISSKRFTDLLHTLNGITPKLLTTRLRELEANGVVERDQAEGRRDVWYRLTPKGIELRPVIEALLVWGIDHTPPPAPTIVVEPGRSRATVLAMLNRRRIRPERETVWKISAGSESGYQIRFDGDRWLRVNEPEREEDIHVTAPLDVWVGLLKSGSHPRDAFLGQVRIQGDPVRAAEFVRLIGHPER
jgi:DNA-binding HxlR family transcriptional regulator